MVPPAEGAVDSTVEAPLHRKLPLLLAIVGAGGVPPVPIDIVLLLPLVPQLFDWLAKYVPALLTAIALPVCPVLQDTVPVTPEAMRVVVDPLQSCVPLDEEIEGDAGVFAVAIVMLLLAPLVPHELLLVA